MPWLSLTDAATTYSCSTRTIRRKIEGGKLTSKLSDGLRMVWLAEQVHTMSSHKSLAPKKRAMIPLFELYEGLSLLRMRFEGSLEMADWLDRCAPPSPNGHVDTLSQTGKFFFDKLNVCFHQVDTLLTSDEMARTVLWNTYRTLVILKSHWQESGFHLQEDQVEPKMAENTKTFALLSHGLEQVRRLLLLCPQPSSSETVSRSLVVQEGVVEVGSDSHAVTHEDLVSQMPMEETPFLAENKKTTLSQKGTRDGKTEVC